MPKEINVTSTLFVAIQVLLSVSFSIMSVPYALCIPSVCQCHCLNLFNITFDLFKGIFFYGRATVVVIPMITSTEPRKNIKAFYDSHVWWKLYFFSCELRVRLREEEEERYERWSTCEAVCNKEVTGLILTTDITSCQHVPRLISMTVTISIHYILFHLFWDFWINQTFCVLGVEPG